MSTTRSIRKKKTNGFYSENFSSSRSQVGQHIEFSDPRKGQVNRFHIRPCLGFFLPLSSRGKMWGEGVVIPALKIAFAAGQGAKLMVKCFDKVINARHFGARIVPAPEHRRLIIARARI